MNTHKNARLTYLRRLEMVQDITKHGLSASESARVHGVIALDIDHFKQINDTYGHPLGDEVLKRLSGIMQTNARADDLLARLGGEEFALVLPEADAQAALLVAERLRQIVAGADMPGGMPVTVSLGVAVWPEHGADFAAVYALADQALYRAKSEGRNVVRLYQPEQGQAGTI